MVQLLGETVHLQRIGTNGDLARAAALCRQLDGRVDALGIGGTNLRLRVGERSYRLAAAAKIVASVQRTPCVDGAGLKTVLERGLAGFVDERIGKELHPRRALFASGVDRGDMAAGFVEAGYECVYGDLMFGLGLPIAIRRAGSFASLARLTLPVVRRMPLRWLYPMGAAQESGRPRFHRWYRWAKVLCGDCLYLKRHAPEDLVGKLVVTNTTTGEDLLFFRRRGVRHLVTSTPRIDGRTYGTNLMEAALVAVAGQRLETDQLRNMVRELQWVPDLQLL